MVLPVVPIIDAPVRVPVPPRVTPTPAPEAVAVTGPILVWSFDKAAEH